MATLVRILLIISYVGIGIVDGLECYNCTSVDSVGNCFNTVHCQNEQSCYLEVVNKQFTLGCIDNRQCSSHPHETASLVGRSNDGVREDQSDTLHGNDVWYPSEHLVKREQQNCFECCSTDICNRHLCEHPKPSSCIDDPKLDCALLNSKFNICQTTHEAKTVCPKFCGLCSLVDGNWADWSKWSICDVTCGNGTQVRYRNCSNPAPVSGGMECQGVANETLTCNPSSCPIDGVWTGWSSWSLCGVTCGDGTQTRTRSCANPSPAFNGQNCSGISVENRSCSNVLCQVNGGWTHWLSWEACSVSCGFGIQQRHRDCTNPVPQNTGQFCIGDTMNVRLCQNTPCAIDGDWTDWSSWSQCDVTCGNGTQTRARSCANPAPSYNGRKCSGISIEDKQCSKVHCPIYGNWTQWLSWEPCSMSCGYGIQQRHRHCTNPVPQYSGQYCTGDSFEVQQCQDKPCSVTPTVAFSSKDIKDTNLTLESVLVFTTTTLNVGNGYDNTTGMFTAPVPGTYAFSVHLCLAGSASNVIYYAILQNGIPIESGLFQSDNKYECHSANAIAVLQVNDTVCVKNMDGNPSHSLYENSFLWNTFSGFSFH